MLFRSFVIEKLRAQVTIDAASVSIWGDSFAENNANRRIAVPLRIDEEPAHSEPLGPALALLSALFDDKLKAIVASGGLVSIRSVLDSQFVHLPHDFVMPRALLAGDLSDIAQTIAPRPIRLDRMVDGTNRPAKKEVIEKEWSRVRQAFKKHGRESSLSVNLNEGVGDWLIRYAK